MTTLTRRVIAVAFVVLLVASPVQALIPDPIESGLLARIAALLEAIEQFRMRVMAKLEEQINIRVTSYAFPARLFGSIQASTAAVVDIRRQLQRMACDWPMSTRMRGLSDMLWQRHEFCRGSHQGVWGSHEAFWDAPIQETNDYVATMTANMISERAEKTNTSWVRVHKDLFNAHAILRSSPGEANRAEAAALAWANEVAVGNSQMATHHLLVRQMERILDRFDEKKASDATYYAYRGLSTLAGATWIGPPPDPSEELPR